MLEGRIKVMNSAGFGFIETDRRIDFYFHYTQLKDDWKKTLKRFVSDEILVVEFENDPDAPSGPRAKNVLVKDSVGKS